MKLVKESLRDILKPKTQEDILDLLKGADPCDIIWSENIDWKDVPIDKLPLIFQVWEDFSKRFPESITRRLRGCRMGSMGKYVGFDALMSSRTKTKKDDREIWVKDMPNGEVMFKMYPFKKIKPLKDIILANNYMLENMDQYHTLVKHL